MFRILFLADAPTLSNRTSLELIDWLLPAMAAAMGAGFVGLLIYIWIDHIREHRGVIVDVKKQGAQIVEIRIDVKEIKDVTGKHLPVARDNRRDTE